jgi:hypothetical protein
MTTRNVKREVFQAREKAFFYRTLLIYRRVATMDAAKKVALRALKILRHEISQLSNVTHIEMSKETFDRLRENTKTDLFDLEDGKMCTDLGMLDFFPIKENERVPFGKARLKEY